jgi:hypothetical protein
MCLPRRSRWKRRGELKVLESGASHPLYGLGLRAFETRDDFELDLVTFIQGPEAQRFDRGVVDEAVRTIDLGDEAESLVRVKPLHRPTGHGMILLAKGQKRAAVHDRRDREPEQRARIAVRSLTLSRGSTTTGDH